MRLLFVCLCCIKTRNYAVLPAGDASKLSQSGLDPMCRHKPPNLIGLYFLPLSGVEEKHPAVFSWRGAAEALNLPGLASLRTEGGGASVWNSPGSCVSCGLMGNQRLTPPHLSHR